MLESLYKQALHDVIESYDNVLQSNKEAANYIKIYETITNGACILHAVPPFLSDAQANHAKVLHKGFADLIVDNELCQDWSRKIHIANIYHTQLHPHTSFPSMTIIKEYLQNTNTDQDSFVLINTEQETHAIIADDQPEVKVQKTGLSVAASNMLKKTSLFTQKPVDVEPFVKPVVVQDDDIQAVSATESSPTMDSSAPVTPIIETVEPVETLEVAKDEQESMVQYTSSENEEESQIQKTEEEIENERQVKALNAISDKYIDPVERSQSISCPEIDYFSMIDFAENHQMPSNEDSAMLSPQEDSHQKMSQIDKDTKPSVQEPVLNKENKFVNQESFETYQKAIHNQNVIKEQEQLLRQERDSNLQRTQDDVEACVEQEELVNYTYKNKTVSKEEYQNLIREEQQSFNEKEPDDLFADLEKETEYSNDDDVMNSLDNDLESVPTIAEFSEDPKIEQSIETQSVFDDDNNLENSQESNDYQNDIDSILANGNPFDMEFHEENQSEPSIDDSDRETVVNVAEDDNPFADFEETDISEFLGEEEPSSILFDESDNTDKSNNESELNDARNFFENFEEDENAKDNELNAIVQSSPINEKPMINAKKAERKSWR